MPETLSARQRAIRQSDTPMARQRESQDIAKYLLDWNLERNHGRNDIEWHPRALARRNAHKRGTSQTRSTRRAQPLPHDVQTRLDRVMAASKAIERQHEREQKRKRDSEINTRLAKLRAFDVDALFHRAPEPVDPLDATIDLQLSTQNEQHRPMLRKLYLAAVANNELYFAGKLALPIIVVDRLTNAQANCATRGRDTVITFDIRTLEGRSYSDLADILLHEQIHQAIGEAGREANDRNHGFHHAEFARIANNIARQRGWPDCSEQNKLGARAAQYWPPRTHF